MSYEKQEWEDGVTLINAEKMNHIEEGIFNAFSSGGGGSSFTVENYNDDIINETRFIFSNGLWVSIYDNVGLEDRYDLGSSYTYTIDVPEGTYDVYGAFICSKGAVSDEQISDNSGIASKVIWSCNVSKEYNGTDVSTSIRIQGYSTEGGNSRIISSGEYKGFQLIVFGDRKER